MGPGTSTAFQHDAVVQANGDLTIFDDGAGPPRVHQQSRGIEVAPNLTDRKATLVRQLEHSPPMLADFEGSVQDLAGGEMFLGWGQQPYFTEYNTRGQMDFDAHFVTPTASYRAYRFPWAAQPPTRPALAAGTSASGDATLWESWNGATDVTAWRVLAGTQASSLAAIGRYPKYRFESTLTPGTGYRDVAVQALGSSGRVLATSPAETVPAHVQLFGSSAFVSSASGTAGVPVGCYSPKPCRLTATVTSGSSVLARSGRQYYAAGAGGVLYFRLSPAGRATLARSSSRRLSVRITVQDSSTAHPATAALELVAFSAGGVGPHRVYTQTSQLRFLSGTDFVSSTGVGAVLAECLRASPCHVRTTLTAAGATIATTGGEYIGADQVGYLYFTLGSAGRAVLARAAGNQLPVHVSITGAGPAASAELALVGFR
jgi:hypothetical protein